jgi:hypothetical protein
LIEQNSSANALNLSRAEDGSQPEVTPAKKPFVEPEISLPVDVLEATTFFLPVDSGTTP